MKGINYQDGLDIYKQDLDYQNQGIVDALSNLFASIMNVSSSTGMIARGFDVRISLADNKKLDIYNNNILNRGDAFSKQFQYIEFTSTGLISAIPLYNYTPGTINVLAIKYNQLLTDNRINIVNGNSQATRTDDSFIYQCFTSTGFIGMVNQGWIELARVTAQGASPITNLDLSGRTYVGALLQAGQITEAELSPLLRLYQTVVRQSSIYNDNFTIGGIKTSLEDDINEIRSILKQIQGTASYTSLSGNSLLDFDQDINALSGEGVLRGVLDEFDVETSTGLSCNVGTGKVFFNKKIGLALTSTGLIFAPSSSGTQGNYIAQTNPDIIIFPGNGIPENFIHKNIIPGSLVVLSSTGAFNWTGLIGTDLTVDYVNGTITRNVSVTVGDHIHCYYMFYESRLDIIQIDNNYQPTITVKQGTAVDDDIVPLVEPSADVDHFKLYAVKIGKNQTTLTSTGIYDRHPFLQKVNQNVIFKNQIIDASISSIPTPVYFNTSTGSWLKSSFVNKPIGLYVGVNQVVQKGLFEFVKPHGLTLGDLYANSNGTLTHTKTIVKMGFVNGSTGIIVDVRYNVPPQYNSLIIDNVTNTGTWIVPDDVYTVYLTEQGSSGGGGGGGSGGYASTFSVSYGGSGGGGGGSGEKQMRIPVTTIPGQSIAYIIHAGGSGGLGGALTNGDNSFNVGVDGNDGQQTSFNGIIAQGGKGGLGGTINGGGAAGGSFVGNIINPTIIASPFMLNIDHGVGAAGGNGGTGGHTDIPVIGNDQPYTPAIPGNSGQTDINAGGSGGMIGTDGTGHGGSGGGGGSSSIIAMSNPNGGNGGNGGSSNPTSGSNGFDASFGPPGNGGGGGGGGGGNASGTPKGEAGGHGGNGGQGWILLEWYV